MQGKRKRRLSQKEEYAMQVAHGNRQGIPCTRQLDSISQQLRDVYGQECSVVKEHRLTCVSRALNKPSEYAPSAGEEFSTAQISFLYHRTSTVSAPCRTSLLSPFGRSSTENTGTHTAESAAAGAETSAATLHTRRQMVLDEDFPPTFLAGRRTALNGEHLDEA